MIGQDQQGNKGVLCLFPLADAGWSDIGLPQRRQAGRSLFYGRMDSRDMGLEKRKEDAENARALFSWVVAFVMSTPMLEGGGDSAGSRTVLFGRAHSCERNANKNS